VTVPEIIPKIDAAGGLLMLDGDRIRLTCRKLSVLISALREHRDKVLQAFRS